MRVSSIHTSRLDKLVSAAVAILLLAACLATPVSRQVFPSVVASHEFWTARWAHFNDHSVPFVDEWGSPYVANFRTRRTYSRGPNRVDDGGLNDDIAILPEWDGYLVVYRWIRPTLVGAALLCSLSYLVVRFLRPLAVKRDLLLCLVVSVPLYAAAWFRLHEVFDELWRTPQSLRPFSTPSTAARSVAGALVAAWFPVLFLCRRRIRSRVVMLEVRPDETPDGSSPRATRLSDEQSTSASVPAHPKPEPEPPAPPPQQDQP